MEYVLKRSKRRSVQIQIDYDGAILVKAPLTYATKKIDAFVLEKQDWIHKSQSSILENNLVSSGYFHILGEKFKVIFRKTLKNYVSRDDNHIIIETTKDNNKHTLLHQYFRKEANNFLQQRFALLLQSVRQHSLYTDRPLHIKKFKRKWGCCSYGGVITLNYKLYHAPISVIDSVILHELCHLKYFNHSNAFYTLLEKLDPDYRHHSEVLKQYSGYLLQ